MNIYNVSFGKDSTAMLLRAIELGRQIDKVVFIDTTKEFDAVYRLRDMERHFPCL